MHSPKADKDGQLEDENQPKQDGID
jgi:hypothetical protein